MLCYVSDLVFIAYGYVAMINSQSLRGHDWGLQCCGVADFFVCGISVNKAHRAVLRCCGATACDVCVFKPTVFGVKRNLVPFFV